MLIPAFAPVHLISHFGGRRILIRLYIYLPNLGHNRGELTLGILNVERRNIRKRIFASCRLDHPRSLTRADGLWVRNSFRRRLRIQKGTWRQVLVTARVVQHVWSVRRQQLVN